eukprot:GHRQ01033985.1.p1 GENE.GHRQ01033985.1~~GHRQ01033985.1.p1  ORF type:complete len:149 (-),score=41.05 GHRQ01033985.1:249-695(-)
MAWCQRANSTYGQTPLEAMPHSLVAVVRFLQQHHHNLTLHVFRYLGLRVASPLQALVQHGVVRLQHHQVKPPLREEVAAVVVDKAPASRHDVFKRVNHLHLQRKMHAAAAADKTSFVLNLPAITCNSMQQQQLQQQQQQQQVSPCRRQ